MRLADWRREQGLSQVELAERIGCVQSLISLIERAVDPRIPSADVMIRIFTVTRGAVTLNDLAFPDGIPDFDTLKLALDGPDPQPGSSAAPLLDAIGDGGRTNAEGAAAEAHLQDMAA